MFFIFTFLTTDGIRCLLSLFVFLNIFIFSQYDERILSNSLNSIYAIMNDSILPNRFENRDSFELYIKALKNTRDISINT